tara:strand:+ start:247 stop:1905 length:1659 start_codon:yes stop_codon:yes gene_type:complete
MSNPYTIFFEGFTTDFTTDFTQVGANLDPSYWIKPSGVGSVDTHPRLDPGTNGWNDGAGANNPKYNMYKLSPHDGSDTDGNNRVYTGQGVLALTGFPVIFDDIANSNGTEVRGIGIGFYINKLATEPSGINSSDSHAQRLLKIYNSNYDNYSTDFANASGVIEIDVIHSTGSTQGYGGVGTNEENNISITDSQNISLRVRTPAANKTDWVEKYFDVNVLGSVWNYLQPDGDTDYTRSDQRIISTFTESSSTPPTFNGDDYYNGLFVEISILPIGTTISTDYQMQIRLNGMNLYERGKTQDDQTLTGLNASVFHEGDTNVFFDRIDWYGSRTGVASFDTADANTQVFNDSTWIDDIYIVANTGVNSVNLTHADNFLGSSTKVFALFPDSTGINQSGSWRQFSADAGYSDINGSVFSYLEKDDGDNSYVYAEHNNNALMFNFDDITIDAALNINNYIIGGIKITNSSRAVSTGVSFMNVFASGAELASLDDNYSVSGIGDEFSVTGTVYRYQNQYLMYNPITSKQADDQGGTNSKVKWLPEEINNGNFGIMKKS